MKLYKIKKMTKHQNNKKNLYIQFSYFMSKQRNILQNQKEKIMFLNLTKNQNSNDERYVQKNTNLDTKIHRITKKITKSQTIRTYIYNDIQKHRDMHNVKHGHKNIYTK